MPTLYTDFHIHSRYAGGCSDNLSLQTLSDCAKIKGLNILGTGDFTHPEWLKEIRQQLVKVGEGIYSFNEVNFLLTSEVSNNFEQGGKNRKVHHILLSPSFEIVDQVNEYLSKFTNLSSDGRPVVGLPCADMAEGLKSISSDIELIPAHAWTPWFGLFGSKSGFDSLKECYGDQEKHINAIETGLSSDPAMNRRLSQLDRIQMVSFSDAHSPNPWRLGREATIFDADLRYSEIIKAIRTGTGLKGTIELDANWGKYHADGHRKCDVWMEPAQAKKYNERCPRCGKRLTIGVLNRIEQLADRPADYVHKTQPPFYRLLPLSELIASVLSVSSVNSRTVNEVYYKLVSKFGSEYSVLLYASPEELYEVVKEKVAEIILKNRNGNLVVQPGYDGVYGKLLMDATKIEEPKFGNQKSLVEFD